TDGDDFGPGSSTSLTSLSLASWKSRSAPLSPTRRTSLSLPGVGDGDLGPGSFFLLLGGPFLLEMDGPGERFSAWPISTWSSSTGRLKSKPSGASSPFSTLLLRGVGDGDFSAWLLRGVGEGDFSALLLRGVGDGDFSPLASALASPNCSSGSLPRPRRRASS